jgi:hypothetical protein
MKEKQGSISLDMKEAIEKFHLFFPITLHGITYQVRPFMSKKNLGGVNHKKKLIQLRPDYDFQSIQQTLWHEVIHIIFEQARIDATDAQVDAVAVDVFDLLGRHEQLIPKQQGRK